MTKPLPIVTMNVSRGGFDSGVLMRDKVMFYVKSGMTRPEKIAIDRHLTANTFHVIEKDAVYRVAAAFPSNTPFEEEGITIAIESETTGEYYEAEFTHAEMRHGVVREVSRWR